jgi:hypothetical protein
MRFCDGLADAPIGSDRNLPKQQRRGAIIILAMLALARRHVVMEKVDVLLKVGLGAFGKVSSVSLHFVE